MKAIALALVVGAVMGAAVVWLGRGPAPAGLELARDPSEPEPVAGRAGLEGGGGREIARLREELALERSLRETLAARLADLEAELALDSEWPDDVASLEPGTPSASPAEREGAAGQSAGGRDWFDPDALAAAGYPPTEIDRVRETWERAVMLRLELEDERMRAGEQGARAAIRDALRVERQARDELGDDAYDAMLYATGVKNRIVLAALIDGAPAATAGVEAGDEVISYDGERVFRPRDLKRLTGVGERGQPIELRVRRSGELFRLFVPRGPLGVRLAMESRPPER